MPISEVGGIGSIPIHPVFRNIVYMKKNQIEFIFDYLKELYPNPKTELDYSTDFQLLVAVILSAQTTDKQVNKVTKNLFKKIKKPEDILIMGFEKFKKTISSVNYFNGKAKYIYETAKKLVEIWKIPDDLIELQKLPGVWIKTAKVILHVLYDMPFIAVDTHVHRVTNRLWLVKTNEPEKTSELLEKIVPDKYKPIAHHSLILFGRYLCKARNPMCDECGLKNICKYYKGLKGKKGVKGAKLKS